MIREIPLKFAVQSALILLASVIVFHILILIQVIPFGIVWGGRLKTLEDMYRFEITSIVTNLLIIALVSVRANYIKVPISTMIVKVLLWLCVILFALNTLANLFAESLIEAIIFTPLTAALCIFCYRMVIGETTYE
jgi:hypothetical protein